MQKNRITFHHATSAGRSYSQSKGFSRLAQKVGQTLFVCTAALVFILLPVLLLTVGNQPRGLSSLPSSTDDWPVKTAIKWQTENLNGHDYYYTYLGEYPQTYVGDELNRILNDEQYSLSTTGHRFARIDSNYDEYISQYYDEYLYNGEKYVKCQPSTGYSYDYCPTYKNGESYFYDYYGEEKWFKVEPIKWWIIDGTNPNNVSETTEIKVISDVGLFSTYNKDPEWASSKERARLNSDFLEEALLVNSKGSIIKYETIQNNSESLNDGSAEPTQDYIWLPSNDELWRTFVPSEDLEGKYYLRSHRLASDANANNDTNASRLCSPSDYALSCYVDFNNNYSTDYRQGTCSYYGRSIGGGTYDNTGIYCEGELSDGNQFHYGAIRPCMTLIYDPQVVEDVPSSLPDVVSSNSSDYDIYKVVNEDGKIDFHIKSEEGLKLLSTYTELGAQFDENWTFYIEKDINVKERFDNVTQIGGETNPFNCVIEGQNHTIFYKENNFKNGKPFGYADESKFHNLTLNEILSLDKLVEEGVHDDIYKITNAETGEIDFHILTPAGLMVVSNYSKTDEDFQPTWTFHIDENLDLTGYDFHPLGGGRDGFCSKFDGHNHTIKVEDLIGMDDYDGTFACFFGLTYCATIENVVFDVNFKGERLAAGVAIECGNTIFSNITVNGNIGIREDSTISESYAAGIAIVTYEGCVVKNCNVYASVKAELPNAAGKSVILAGGVTMAEDTIFINDSFYGDILIDVANGVAGFAAGGVAGSAQNCQFMYCDVYSSIEAHCEYAKNPERIEENSVGGLAAAVIGCPISQCNIFSPKIHVYCDWQSFVGGVAGMMVSRSSNNSASIVTVDGVTVKSDIMLRAEDMHSTGDLACAVGGLFGAADQSSLILNVYDVIVNSKIECYSKTVNGDGGDGITCVGGIFGWNDAAETNLSKSLIICPYIKGTRSGGGMLCISGNVGYTDECEYNYTQVYFNIPNLIAIGEIDDPEQPCLAGAGAFFGSYDRPAKKLTFSEVTYIGNIEASELPTVLLDQVGLPHDFKFTFLLMSGYLEDDYKADIFMNDCLIQTNETYFKFLAMGENEQNPFAESIDNFKNSLYGVIFVEDDVQTQYGNFIPELWSKLPGQTKTPKLQWANSIEKYLPSLDA